MRIVEAVITVSTKYRDPLNLWWWVSLEQIGTFFVATHIIQCDDTKKLEKFVQAEQNIQEEEMLNMS